MSPACVDLHCHQSRSHVHVLSVSFVVVDQLHLDGWFPGRLEALLNGPLPVHLHLPVPFHFQCTCFPHQCHQTLLPALAVVLLFWNIYRHVRVLVLTRRFQSNISLLSSPPHGCLSLSPHAVQPLCFLMFSFVFCFARASRVVHALSSVTTRKPHQYWCVSDYEGTSKQFNDTFHTHAKNKINSLKNYQHQIPSKEARASSSSKIYTPRRGTNKMKESPPSREPQPSPFFVTARPR